MTALHQDQHWGKESRHTGFEEEQSATILGWEEKFGIASKKESGTVGVTDVDKTSVMPDLRFLWRFPAPTRHRQGWLEATAGDLHLQSQATTHLR